MFSLRWSSSMKLLVAFGFGFCSAMFTSFVVYQHSISAVRHFHSCPYQTVDDSSEATELPSSNTHKTPPHAPKRLACWIMTTDKNHYTKAVHVNVTWAPRCDRVFFMSNKYDSRLHTIVFNISEGHDNLWRKTFTSLLYLYDNHLHNFEFFLKADDDTYVIVENLRLLMGKISASDAVYFGRRFKWNSINQGYMSGGAGYVLTKEALRRVVELGFRGKSKQCLSVMSSKAEDIILGKCLEAVGVKAIDSRDSFDRERFHPYDPQSHVGHGIGNNDWIHQYNFYPVVTVYNNYPMLYIDGNAVLKLPTFSNPTENPA